MALKWLRQQNKYSAKTDAAEYAVAPESDASGKWWAAYVNNEPIGRYPKADDAKAACQRDAEQK